MNDDKIDINASDRLNPLWQKILVIYEQRLLELRKLNDREQDDTMTARIRGQIAEVKALLAKNEDDPVIG